MICQRIISQISMLVGIGWFVEEKGAMEVFDQNGKLDSDVQDVLYELGNAGVGMATATIGKILGVRVALATPVVVPVGEQSDKILHDLMQLDNVGIWMKFQEPLKGSVLFILKQNFVYDVVEKMTGTHYDGNELYEDEVAFSAVKEFANMLAAAYTKAIGKYTSIRIYMSPSMLVLNKERVSLGDILQNQGTDSKKAIWVETSFQLLNQEGKGDETIGLGKVVMLPDADTVQMLAEALGL